MPIYRGNVAGGGSSVAPSNTVEDETAFGVAKAAGIAAAYSRGDHTHGTPAAPSIPGPAATVEDETAFGVAKAAGIAATYSRGDHTHGTPAAPAVIISANIFRGITPTAALFTTNPTTLANTTDGDFSTVTGTGTKVMAGGGSWGTLTYDLGSVKTVFMGARVGLWTSASSCYVFFESSNDNIIWTATGIEDSVIQTLAAAEQISDSLSQILTGRYFRLRFHVFAAATCNCKIYEVYGWPLLI